MDSSTITTKGQTTIPADIRRQLHLKTGDKVRCFVTETGTIKLVPLKGSIRNLKGMLPKPKRSVSIAAMDKAIARYLGEKHTIT